MPAALRRLLPLALAVALAHEALAAPSWRQVSATGPSARSAFGMAWDPASSQILLFGGCGLVKHCNSGDDWTRNLGDLWAWDGTSWTDLDVGDPTPRYGPVFAGGADGLLLLGGNAIHPTSDAWQWKDGWSLLDTPPPARTWAAAAFDSKREVVVFVGGEINNAMQEETWDWSPRDGFMRPPGLTNSPGPRMGAAMAFDEKRNRMVLFGGRADGVTVFADTWVLECSLSCAWRQLDTKGEEPKGRWGHAMAFHPETGLVVMTGGDAGGSGNQLLDEAWALEGDKWVKLPAPGVARWRHGLAYDPVRSQLVLFGGLVQTGPVNDTWVFEELEVPDAGHPPDDAGSDAPDAGHPPDDAGSDEPDAGHRGSRTDPDDVSRYACGASTAGVTAWALLVLLARRRRA